MQSENLSDFDEPPTENQARKPRSKKANLLISIHAATFLLGVFVLGFVIYKIGYQKIIESVTAVGWGFFIIVALNIVRHLLRSASLYLAVEPARRTFKYRSAVAARFGGEAVNFFSFTGPFLGDAAKAVLLRKNLPLTYGASAVIFDSILYYLSVILVVLTGVAALVVAFGSGGKGVANALILIVVFSIIGFSLVILAITYRVTPFSFAIKWSAKRNLAPKFLIAKQQNILDVENNVFQFYHNRRADFFKVFLISLSVHAVSVTEVYLALQFLGFDALISTAFIIESLTKVINAVFSFIPGTIGVYEGGNGIILQMLGYTVAVGVALALVRRGAILLSTSIGVIILL
ncbi:MAG: lysylphosphatidylglycerol synthase domain-containing protein, partial [Pyrinomonadaceae bacterium]